MDEFASDPIIIYGAPRSGTTYLVALLNKHPDIFITSETRVFVWVHRTLKRVTQEAFAVFKERDVFVRHLTEAYPNLIRTYYSRLTGGRRFWGDKNPHYLDPSDEGCLETTLELFPGAKFIHIIRDGRAAAVSVMRKAWEDFEVAHKRWPAYVEIGRSFGARVGPAHYHEIVYEDFTRDDLSGAKELFSFLGIDLHQEVVDFCNKQVENRIPINNPTSDLASAAPLKDWEELLLPDLKLRSLELIGDSLVQYGYETEASLGALRERLRGESTQGEEFAGVRRAVRDVTPPNASLAVISGGDDRLLLNLEGRRALHVPQKGQNVHVDAPPSDGAAAIAAVQELVGSDRPPQFLVVPRTMRWWLEKYPRFREYLATSSRVLRDDDAATIYQLGS